MRPFLSALDNPLVKRLRRLHEVAGRREEGLILVEGTRAIDGLLTAGWRPQHLLVREGDLLPEGWVPLELESQGASSRVIERCSVQSTPSGVIAAFPIPPEPLIDPTAGGLVLTGIQDPGNLGTLLRCAAAFSLRQVVIVGGADPFGPKAIQATAGCLASLRLSVRTTDAAPAEVLGAPGCALVVTGGTAPRLLAKHPRWLVVGGEANGVPEVWRSACVETCTLPMPGGTESLNAAVAGAIAAYLLHVDG
jgi:TrmH family RNA methyltransferase